MGWKIGGSKDGENEAGSEPAPGWERDLLQRLAFANLDEQRRARRWNIGFKLFFVFYLLFILVLGLSGNSQPKSPSGEFTALVDLTGTIAPNEHANADNIVTALREAFKSKAKAVILRTNSGGGTTVQSAYISDEIKRLRKLHGNKPIYGVIADVCASGCYYIISQTDKIYANESSIVGSIGVLMDGGFGFAGPMKRWGVERRLFTAGDHKGSYDPFSPLSADDRIHMKKMLDEVHRQFIAVVRAGRGERLKESPLLYSGRFWTGMTAKKLGLVDDFGSASFVAREIVGAERIVDFSRRPSFFERLSRQIGASAGKALGASLKGSVVPATGGL